MLDLHAGTVSLVKRAKGYPYGSPDSCFALACGRVLPLVRVDLSSALECEVLDDGEARSLGAWARWRGMDIERADAPELLLAYGSNASVAVLSRKLADCLHASVIAVAKATLVDFEVVYSAHLASYGAIPATLQHSPGARTTVYLLVTTPAQCRVLRRTEPNYHFARLDAIDLRLELGPTLSSVPAVISRHGALRLNGTEVGVAAVETLNRRFPALTQAQVLRAVRDLVAPGVDLDDFILENVQNAELARRRCEELRRTARQFAYRSWRVVDAQQHQSTEGGPFAPTAAGSAGRRQVPSPAARARAAPPSRPTNRGTSPSFRQDDEDEVDDDKRADEQPPARVSSTDVGSLSVGQVEGNDGRAADRDVRRRSWEETAVGERPSPGERIALAKPPDVSPAPAGQGGVQHNRDVNRRGGKNGAGLHHPS